MKSGKYVKNRMNREVFKYNGTTYNYTNLFQLIKDLHYETSEKDCDWTVFSVTTIDNKKAVCIAFQETTTKTDWKYDFSFWAKSTKAYKGWENRLKFHSGFFTEYQSARDKVTAEVKKALEEGAEKIFIIGWSLGASIGPICCEDMCYTFGIKPIFIGYEGACPCSNYHTKKIVLGSMNLEESINFRNNTDIVPIIPPFPVTIRIKEIMYQLDYHNIKFPFKLVKTLVSMVRDTAYYHENVDKAIEDLLP